MNIIVAITVGVKRAPECVIKMHHFEGENTKKNLTAPSATGLTPVGADVRRLHSSADRTPAPKPHFWLRACHW